MAPRWINFYQSMSDYNMKLEPGLYSALNKGIFVCPDDTSAPKNFTPFFTPQVSDDDDVEDNANLVKLTIQQKYDSQDIIKLTKMDVMIPMISQDIRHQLKNFTGIVGRCFGSDSLLYKSSLN